MKYNYFARNMTENDASSKPFTFGDQSRYEMIQSKRLISMCFGWIADLHLKHLIDLTYYETHSIDNSRPFRQKLWLLPKLKRSIWRDSLGFNDKIRPKSTNVLMVKMKKEFSDCVVNCKNVCRSEFYRAATIFKDTKMIWNIKTISLFAHSIYVFNFQWILWYVCVYLVLT